MPAIAGDLIEVGQHVRWSLRVSRQRSRQTRRQLTGTDGWIDGKVGLFGEIAQDPVQRGAAERVSLLGGELDGQAMIIAPPEPL